jgi:DNA-binding LacI/PurR family transcriptional regulator
VKKPTIRDVAREAGVSVATVSRVLNDKPDASGESRKRVAAAVSKLGYARSSQWHQITTGKSRVISLHFPNTEANAGQVNADFITGATTACEERDYRLHLMTRPLDESYLLDLYRSSKSDGTILMKVQLHDWRVDFLLEQELPFVMVGHTESNAGGSYVDYDFATAMQMGLEHLMGLGHRNIGYVSAMPSSHHQHGPTVRALRAYQAACRQHDIPVLSYETDQSYQHVRLATSHMLYEHPEITGLISMREMVETGLYGGVQDVGLRIPDDISVVGLANPHGPELTSPSLTALDFPAWSMAYDAGNMLINQLEEVDATTRQILREPTLTVRTSTAPARRVAR